ncbi:MULTISPECIES: 2-amino-4-hydroxy-6-hydroxymethyldihydropteridine diphosphokinase [unclassified Shewanella]|uniref:2-amino-4-hydroxy-6- hydroxymethyldihydropteridine diphosphokinase n=1 Tax=unclassified Shewanella TaxID=196818 RepID=UPI001BC00B4F|nr:MULTISPECIES: 2-amino-4-hydroxy-6-hydroxymethyldihydropteridine diphosphokinase [unclassified Shewanella]GIU06864.1 2-amino-4-hydroxy-6-hydroxymethyldihydropteridine diphosphokinase [Shewanella sp. MBTL60-112-B1]GIU26247.1 2-amino-4-hydroxy-6-hydroxymethyldihydropteridine diphosphokinase [Shewanella sp. MBTL60-112-B2]
MAQVYVALGANLADPISQLNNACDALLSLANADSFSVSSYYRSAPMGDVEQPDYVNAVAGFQTDLAPIELLDALQSIENLQGRVRELRWGPRTLDLDLLLYDKQFIDTPRLTVPHYGMRERSFVLVPLADIAPELILPDNTPLSSLLNDSLRAELVLAHAATAE